MNTSRHSSFTVHQVDSVAAAFEPRLIPQMEWSDKDVGFACGVRAVLNYMKSHEGAGPLDPDNFLKTGTMAVLNT